MSCIRCGRNEQIERHHKKQRISASTLQSDLIFKET